MAAPLQPYRYRSRPLRFEGLQGCRIFHPVAPAYAYIMAPIAYYADELRSYRTLRVFCTCPHCTGTTYVLNTRAHLCTSCGLVGRRCLSYELFELRHAL
eukprot:scaffold33767_cov17-Prasinocladus_malaysianus.AAC.1